jgi:hypothetical protein
MIANPNWLGPVDHGRREAFQRALDVSGAGSVLLQTFIDPVVQQLHLRELGASAVLPRRPGRTGNATYVNRRTPGTDAEWVDDTTEPTSAEGSYAQTSFTYKTLIIRGTVTRKLQKTGQSYGDTLATEISGRTGDFSKTFENGLIQGDTNSDANQFDGLITLIQAVSGQVVLQTTAAAGDNLTLEKMDEAIDVVKGSAARSDVVILASFKGRRLLNAQLQAQQQFNDMVEVGAGFRVRSYDGIPIVTSSEIPDDSTFDGSTITAMTGEVTNPTTCYIVVNTRFVTIDELTSLTVMPLANKSSQYDEFDLFWDGSLVFHNTKGASILVGVKTS